MQTADTLLTTYDNFLGSLDAWLAKAAEHGGDMLLGKKLAEDMFPLSRQIRFVCNLPGEAMAGAAGDAELWEIPEAHHVGGLQARPEEYERRVVGFFDEALAR